MFNLPKIPISPFKRNVNDTIIDSSSIKDEAGIKFSADLVLSPNFLLIQSVSVLS